MDRSVIEGDPHTVIEGMILGAYAIGASMGYIYIRAEYPIAVDRMAHAIEEARQRGLVGEAIFSGQVFRLISRSASAQALLSAEKKRR